MFFYPFSSVHLKNIMVHDKGDGMGKSGGMAMCMVSCPYFVIVVNSAAFKRRIFQMQDMPAVSSFLEDDKIVAIKPFQFFCRIVTK